MLDIPVAGTIIPKEEINKAPILQIMVCILVLTEFKGY